MLVPDTFVILVTDIFILVIDKFVFLDEGHIYDPGEKDILFTCINYLI